MKPVCVPCKRFYRPKRNGYYFIEGMPTENQAPKGTEAEHLWMPYKLWSGDQWECEGCGAQIVVGTGANPVSEHYKPDFDREVQRYAPELQVNDC